MFSKDKLFYSILISSLFVSSLGQSSYCPNASYLSPYCTCTSTSSSNIVMDCSNVETEEQLNDVFTNTPFSYNHIKELIIQDNSQLRYLTNNVFGTVTFEIITFRNAVIEYVDELVFSKSYSYLKEWYLYSCPFIAVGFPFSSLNQFTLLNRLHLEHSGYLDFMPRIHSSSLKYLKFLYTGIGYLPVTSFYDIPMLINLYLYGNNIASLPLGIFEKNKYLEEVIILENSLGQLAAGSIANLTSLVTLNLVNNNITFIEPGALQHLTKLENVTFAQNYLSYFTSANLGYLPSVKNISVARNDIQAYEKYLFNCCPKLTQFHAGYNKLTKISKDDFKGSEVLQELYVNKNEISTIEPGSFADLKNGFLDLSKNLLTTLDEYWLRGVLEKQNEVDVSNNPLECGCDIAWLYNNENFMTNLDAQCENGTDIQNLDPFFFNTTCSI